MIGREEEILAWTTDVCRQIDAVYKTPFSIKVNGANIEIVIVPGNLLCDNKAVAILLSTYGSGSDYREPWRQWGLLSRSDRVFWQGPIATTIRDIMGAENSGIVSIGS